MRRLARFWFVWASAAASGATQTPQFVQLLNFSGGSGPNEPVGHLAASGGQLFGTTVAGGGSIACLNGCGTIFAAAPSAGSGWTAATIYSFSGGDDGSFPVAGLTAGTGGVLYGAAEYGGTSNHVVIFELTPGASGAWQQTVLHSFDGGADGSYPMGALVIGSQGELYGTTAEGGGVGYGTVFVLTPPADGSGRWTKQVLYSFSGGADGSTPTKALTIDPETGGLYGVTRVGGGHNFGTVFWLGTPAAAGGAWRKRTIYSFKDENDGAFPNELVLGEGGALYGTTEGYINQGNVFALDPPAAAGDERTLTVLHGFANDFIDGAQPSTGLTWANGVLYGTTAAGGTDENCTCGTAFSLTPPATTGGAWGYQLIVSFAGTEGVAPEAPLLYGGSGILYGTTSSGGSHAAGTIFALKLEPASDVSVF